MAGSSVAGFGNLLRWRGRATRRDFWLAFGIFLAAWIVSLVAIFELRAIGAALALVLAIPATLLFSLLGARRLRDRNRPPLVFVLFVAAPGQLLKLAGTSQGLAQAALVSVAGAILVWAFIELAVLPGTTGRNRYGDDPLRPSNAEVFT